MSSYKDLEIYKLSYDLANRVHKASLKLPAFELYEQGSQIRRSSKSIRDTIVEGYGRRRYKAEFIRYLIYAQSSCDEATNQAQRRATGVRHQATGVRHQATGAGHQAGNALDFRPHASRLTPEAFL
jgi:four helix bundle protein